MNNNNRIFANNLSFYMKQKGVDRYQLCEALGFKYSTVSEWLSAKKYPRMDKIEILADYFGIKKSDLIEITGPFNSINAQHSDELSNSLQDSINYALEFSGDQYANDPKYILHYYNRLNSAGRTEATRRVREMASLDEYTKPDEEGEE